MAQNPIADALLSRRRDKVPSLPAGGVRPTFGNAPDPSFGRPAAPPLTGAFPGVTPALPGPAAATLPVGLPAQAQPPFSSSGAAPGRPPLAFPANLPAQANAQPPPFNGGLPGQPPVIPGGVPGAFPATLPAQARAQPPAFNGGEQPAFATGIPPNVQQTIAALLSRGGQGGGLTDVLARLGTLRG